MKFVQSVSTMGVTAIAVSLMNMSGALAQLQDSGPIDLPEPSMLGLFAVGLIGAIAVSRMRK